MSQEIAFYINKAEEVTVESLITPNTATYFVLAPIYSDLGLTNKVGNLTIKKEVLDVKNGVLSPDSTAIYNYQAAWNVTGVNGSSIFTINLGKSIVNDGSSEVPGTYYGALDGVASSGDFRNYGGSVRKIKDSTNVRQYLLSYSPFNPYNTLPQTNTPSGAPVIPCIINPIVSNSNSLNSSSGGDSVGYNYTISF